jgi:hypothetical protein
MMITVRAVNVRKMRSNVMTVERQGVKMDFTYQAPQSHTERNAKSVITAWLQNATKTKISPVKILEYLYGNQPSSTQVKDVRNA